MHQRNSEGSVESQNILTSNVYFNQTGVIDCWSRRVHFLSVFYYFIIYLKKKKKRKIRARLEFHFKLMESSFVIAFYLQPTSQPPEESCTACCWWCLHEAAGPWWLESSLRAKRGREKSDLSNSHNAKLGLPLNNGISQKNLNSSYISGDKGATWLMNRRNIISSVW